MNILIVRFRQIGDALLSTVIMNTLRQNFPDATIDFVLNERIAPLFQGHPSIDHVITFSEEERHHALRYVRKVWNIVHRTRYDVIIDMRSTLNTVLFALFSPGTPYRIGLKKAYTLLLFNYRKQPDGSENMIDQNLSLLRPLERLRPIVPCRQFTLAITDKERNDFRDYMQACGADLRRPLLLIGVTAKIQDKCWSEDRMTWVLRQLLNEFPQAQLIFNYAPGEEEKRARAIWENLQRDPRILIDLKASSMRELYAMAHYIKLYFGNEGGARHVVHAAGVPSFVVMAPGNQKHRWLPQNEVYAGGIEVGDVVPESQLATMTRRQQYDAITQERVWEQLREVCRRFL